MAELTLAILPLVISALDHYTTVHRAVSRYQKFSQHVDEFAAQLRIQCGIFQTSVQLVLATEVGDEQAVHMLGDENDVAWNDSELDSQLSERFSPVTVAAVKDCLSLIQQKIQKLLEMSGWHVDCAENPRRKLSLRQKTRNVVKKINFACEYGETEKLLGSLRDRTQDFRTLVQQTDQPMIQHPPPQPSQTAKAKAGRFAAVKSAADDLYAAVGQACTIHAEHRAYIGLQPTHDDVDHVNFVLAFRSLQIQTAPKDPENEGQKEVWLTIESQITGSIRPANSSGIGASINKAVKRLREITPTGESQGATPKKGAKNKKVSFQPDPLLDRPLLRSDIRTAKETASNPLVNLCDQSNFCNKMRKLLMDSNRPVGRCIGYLETSGSSKHLVYIHSRMNKVTTTRGRHAMRALSQLLRETSCSTQANGPLALHSRLYVGIQLARALLQFHETRWLKEFWSSDDIVVSDAESIAGNERRQLGDSGQEPYANVSIRGGNLAVTKQVAKPISYIRNRALFSLGKILLELAYQKTFQELQRPEDVESELTDDAKDLRTAKRLVLNVSEKLGPSYAEVVRKCIDCDFGLGDDLACENLQAGFYQYVICELERCEGLARGL
ncbi:hypothetical protein H2200_001878 [Cladophialophora chaetospira]|uniref:DUF7580 domain-containing protein n=1 Tax=Cladophialophora chaetospira TaxID=386627 RepID=A0AA38XLS9_9EURO|nr:hypothetical protein H2200_001878 [Cladophialophora chaetospira]